MVAAFFYFSPSFLYAQCGVNAMFTTSSFTFPGNPPKMVNFTSTSTGSPTTFEWKINGTVVGGNSSTMTYTFSAGNYSACLTVGNGQCTSTFCIDIPIGNGNSAGCDVSCQPVPNFDFETMFNPFPPNPPAPNENGASAYFNDHVCGWYQATSTPYYCNYPTNRYIAIKLEQLSFFGPVEVASTTLPLKNLVHGKTYEVTWKYSIQQESQLSPWPPSTQPLVPLGIAVAMSNGVSIGPTIRYIPSPPIDAPASNGVILPPTDYTCLSPELIQWHTDKFTFVYNSSFPYLVITGTQPPYKIPTQSDLQKHIPYLFVDNIKIECPTSCGLQPIFTIAKSGCGTTFTLVNTPTGGNLTWDYGDGFTGTSATHTYKYPGVFNVCATLKCDDGTFATYCKEVTITAEDCATSCITLTAVNAVKYCGNTSYLGTIKVQVPKGYKPCGTNPTLNGSNANTPVNTNSYKVTSVNASSDEVAISYSINPSTSSSFPASSTSFGFSLCDKNGNTICYIVPVNAIQCTSCNEVNLTATCNQNLSTPGNFVYSGTLPSGITGNVVSTAAGFSSSAGNFQISSATPLPQSTSTTISYTLVAGIYVCTKYIITITPCPLQPSNCVAVWKAKTFFCTEASKSSGNPIFNLSNMTVPLTHSGVTYSLCNSTLGGTIEGGGTVTVNGAIQVGNDLQFNLTINMPAGTYNGQVFEMRLFLCDPNGNLVCFLFNLVFWCESEGGPRSSKIQIGQEELTVYPNPSSDFVTFDLGNGQNYISEIIIFDQLGKEIISENHYSSIFTLDVQSFPTGLYIASVKDANGKNKKVKFIVSH
jgi:hypothetical protein